MALQTDYELDKIIHRDVYMRVHKIRTVMVDYEQFVTVDDPERPTVGEELSWMVRNETTATVYVWDSKEARDRRAQPMKWFSVDFEYFPDQPRNIFQQAYDALKRADEFADAVDV